MSSRGKRTRGFVTSLQKASRTCCWKRLQWTKRQNDSGDEMQARKQNTMSGSRTGFPVVVGVAAAEHDRPHLQRLHAEAAQPPAHGVASSQVCQAPAPDHWRAGASQCGAGQRNRRPAFRVTSDICRWRVQELLGTTLVRPGGSSFFCVFRVWHAGNSREIILTVCQREQTMIGNLVGKPVFHV